MPGLLSRLRSGAAGLIRRARSAFGGGGAPRAASPANAGDTQSDRNRNRRG